MALAHPEWDRPCDVCERQVIDSAGRSVLDKRTALPMARPANTPTPCGSCAKVPEPARRAGLDWRQLRPLAVELTPQNRRAWAFYRECRAVNTFPDDPLVRWYSALIRSVEDAAERAPLNRLTAAVADLVSVLTILRR